jgi:hypothetical protein
VSQTFSGNETADPFALDVVLRDAQSVRITPGGCLVYAVDPDADVLDPRTEKHVVLMHDEQLAHVQGAEEMATLRRLLEVSEFDNFICMCPGDLALEFLDGDGQRLTVLRIDSPGTLDWPLWLGKAEVRDQNGLREWLRLHEADGPLISVEAHRAKWASEQEE